MPEQVRSAECPSEEQRDERLDRIVRRATEFRNCSISSVLRFLRLPPIDATNIAGQSFIVCGMAFSPLTDCTAIAQRSAADIFCSKISAYSALTLPRLWLREPRRKSPRNLFRHQRRSPSRDVAQRFARFVHYSHALHKQSFFFCTFFRVSHFRIEIAPSFLTPNAAISGAEQQRCAASE